MTKVTPRFGATCLLIICPRKCSRSEKLTTDVRSNLRFGQCNNKPDHPNGKIKQPFGERLFLSHNTISKCKMTNDK